MEEYSKWIDSTPNLWCSGSRTAGRKVETIMYVSVRGPAFRSITHRLRRERIQSSIVLSPEPDAINLPSGENATELTQPEWHPGK
jgi:hypothetical protein